MIEGFLRCILRSCGAFLSPASPCSFSFSQSESDFSYMSRWCHLDFFPSGVKLLSLPFCGEGVLSRWGVRPLTTWSLCELSALSDRADCLFSSRISLVLLHEPSEFFQVFFLTSLFSYFQDFFHHPKHLWSACDTCPRGESEICLCLFCFPPILHCCHHHHG